MYDDHHHYGYADERHDHRGEYADDRHGHSLDYAEKYHRHYDEESRVAGLREDLSGAEARICDMDQELGEVRGELRAFKDHAAANLASLNEIVAELAEQAIQIGVEPEFAGLVRGKLRDHSWALGYEFQGERGPAGEPDEPIRKLEECWEPDEPDEPEITTGAVQPFLANPDWARGYDQARHEIPANLLNRIKQIEQSDGSWPGGDVVDILTSWFTDLGFDIEADVDPDEPDEPEPQDYDPGPEVDDEGGMSERRYWIAAEDAGASAPEAGKE